MTQEAYNEIQVLRSCAAGDAAAFEVIVRKYQSLVCAITYSAVGQVDKSEELAQQAFINAWKNLAQLQDLGKFKAWLISITRNVIRTFFRKQKRDIVNNADAIDQIGDVADHSSEPLETIITKEQEAIVEQSLQQIPEMYREPMVLFYRQQQSVREVAEALELSEDTVRTRLMRGRKMLKEQVAAMVESTLSHTGPGKAFTTMVVASIAGLALTSTTATAASGTATGAATTGTAAGLATVMSTITAKVITAAAVVAVAVGAVLTYQHLTKPEQPATQSNEIAVVQDEQEPIVVSENTETFQPEASDAVAAAIEAPENKMAASQNSINAESTSNTEPVTISKTIEIPEPAEYVFEPNGILSGLITDAETGEAVTDAKVTLGGSRYYTAKTDKNGYYSFEKKIHGQGSFRVEVHSAEFVGITDYDKLPMIYLKEDSQEVKHFKLDKACMLDVWVVDKEGLAVKDARVYATSLTDDRRREIGDSRYSRKTDENGYMLLGGFPPSTSPYLITVMHNREKTVSEKDGIRHIESIPNYAYAGQQVVLNDPETILSTEIVLKKGMFVKGYAEYLDGIPAGGLKISANPDWWHSNNCPRSWPIDPNGFFTIDQIIPGTYNLQINIPTGEGSSIGKNLFSTKLPLPEGELLKVTVPEKSPSSLVSISGVVTLKGDKIPNSAEVSAYSRQFGHQSTHLDFNHGKDKQTSFCLNRLEPGSYRLQFTGTDIEPVTMENVQAPCDDIEVELAVVGKPRLIGTVVDAETSEPVVNFKVRAKKLKTHRGPNYVQRNQWTDFRNDNGAFEIEAVGPGLYQVQVSSEGYAAQWSSEIDTDNNTDIVIKLDKGGIITGKVTNSEGHPVPNATVIPLSIATGTNSRTKEIFVSTDGSTQTDKQGQFTLSHLAEGNETLKVAHPDYANEIVEDISVQIGRTTETQPIVLGKGAAIEGFVYDAGGKPESGVTLYVQDASGYGGGNDEKAGRLGIAVTEPNGFYRVDNLSEKMCYMRRQNEGATLGVIRRTVMPQNGKTSRIDFGGKGKLTGQVIIEGQPLVNTKIQLAPQGQPHFGVFKAFAVTDTNGNFTFYPGISGNYTLYYKPAQSRDWNELAKVTLSQDKDLDVGVVPEQTSTLKVYIKQPTEGPEWQIDHVYAIKGTNLYNPLTATAIPPTAPDKPYIFSSLLPEAYIIKLYRSDMLIYHTSVEIKEGGIESDLIIDLPMANSGFHLPPIPNIQFLRLYSDENVQKTLKPDKDGTYQAENLPAGRYHLVNGMLVTDRPALLSFDLEVGETKMIDVSQLVNDSVPMGVCQIQIVDENGTPVSDCRIWMEGVNGKVEPAMQYGFQTAFITFAGEYIVHTAQPGYKDINKPISLDSIDIKDVGNQKPQKILLRLERQ